jgi:hypothetical protein
MTTSKKPKPSKARKSSKLAACVTKPPATLAKDNNDKPNNMLRRKPKLSALKPTAKPNIMLAI